MTSNDIRTKCLMCTEPGTLRCAGCRAVHYCSIECCDASWRFHKVLCSSFKDFQTPPSKDKFRAIYFPEHELLPKFCWLDRLEFRQQLSGEGNIRDLIPGARNVQDVEVAVNGLSGERQERKLRLFFDEEFQIGYSELNKAVTSATQGMQALPWAGAIVACAGKPGSCDFNMVDFHHLIAFFIAYCNRTELLPRLRGPKLPAVLMPCDGEKRLNPTIAPRSVMIPRLHYIWGSKDEVSYISERIGMPLFVIQYLTKSGAWTETGDMGNAAYYMHVNGVPLFRWDTEKVDFWMSAQAGNILVARVDRQFLEPEVAEAFTDFCKYHVKALFVAKTVLQKAAENEGKDNEVESMQAVLREITPAKWTVYLSQCKALKAHNEAVATGTQGGATVLDDGVKDDTIDGVPWMGLNMRDGAMVAGAFLVSHG